MYPMLVADIGGTNARFGLVTNRDLQTNQYQVEFQQTYPCVEYATFELVLAAYLSQLPDDVEITHACIAVAGPVSGDRVSLTNLCWDFSIEALKRAFSLQVLEVINDFAALASSISHIGDADLVVVKSGETAERACKVIIGPGTGLGVAGLVPTNTGWLPIPGEGGHVACAPGNERESAILSQMRRRFEYVSAEMLLSGGGLKNLYLSLCALDGVEAREYKASDIADHAVANSDPQCREALSVFCALLGSLCGDIALIYGARGGVYLGGGILPKIENFLLKSEFNARFRQKGAMAALVAGMPVKLITHKKPALLGAADWLERFEPVSF